ncbi:hypothetical protein Tco_0979090, partial [Tanacetum coccineum]
MNPVAAQQVAIDNALVAPEKRLKIEKCNARIEFSKPQRETTYQVTLDALKLSPCYPAFLITAKVPEIYMHQFWNTIKKIKDTDAYRFKLDKQKNLGTLASVICYLRSIQIICTSPGEHLLLSSIGASLGSLQVLIGSGIQELKSCREYYHKYGALIPEEIINQAIKDSKSYKIYLAYATGVATPKKARKFKKPASPWKKKTLVTVEEEEPEPAKKDKHTKKLATKIKSFGFQIRDTLGVSVSKKKTPAKVSRSKGIELLSDAALLEEAQLKKALRRSKRETTILQEG